MAITHKWYNQFMTITDIFVVPSDVYIVYVTMVGGGGSGGGYFAGYYSQGGAGGAGEYSRRRPVYVTPGEEIIVTLGQGGIAPSDSAYYGGGNNGTPSYFGDYFQCMGGYGGASGNGLMPYGVYSSAGGGVRGGNLWGWLENFTYSDWNSNGKPPKLGWAEGACMFGGGSGTGPGVYAAGLPCEGIPGGNPGQIIYNGNYGGDYYGGPGGPASPFGPGGTGGSGGIHSNYPPDCIAPDDASWGAGGGGTGTPQLLWFTVVGTPAKGGNGGNGACLIEWRK